MSTDPISRQNFTNPPQHSAQTAEQQANSGGDFGKVMATGLGVAANLAGKALGASVGGPLLGGGLGGSSIGGTVSGIQGDLANQQAQFAELIQIQNQMQVQNQQITMVSNASKTEHESRMAPIRNIRA